MEQNQRPTTTVEQRLQRLQMVLDYERETRVKAETMLREACADMTDTSPKQAHERCCRVWDEYVEWKAGHVAEKQQTMAQYDDMIRERNEAPELYERIRASQLIARLIELIAEHGDLPVTSECQYLGNPHYASEAETEDPSFALG